MTTQKQECYFLRRQDDEIVMGRKGLWMLTRYESTSYESSFLQFLGVDGFEGVKIAVCQVEIATEIITEYEPRLDCELFEIKTYKRSTFTVVTERGTKFEGMLVCESVRPCASECEQKTD